MADGDDNVVILPVVTRFNIPSSRVLTKALEADLTGVIVIGWDADEKTYFASSIADAADIVYLMRRSELDLFKIIDEL